MLNASLSQRKVGVDFLLKKQSLPAAGNKNPELLCLLTVSLNQLKRESNRDFKGEQPK